MLGLGGVRLGLVIPGLFAMQVRAVAQAAAARVAAGGDPRPEIMVPLIGAVQELETVRTEALSVLESVPGAPPIRIGTMIEVPSAALTAGQIAGAAEFFSVGTNDLTQMTWGFFRDDVEGAFFGRYLGLGVFAVSPFETIDTDGVGELVRIAVERGRAARPDRRRLRRAWRRPRLGPLLPHRGPRLRVLLPVPGADRPPRSRPGRCRGRPGSDSR